MKIRLLCCFLTLFCITQAQYTYLHTFNDTAGKNPWGSLLLSQNVLYGMTQYGGAYDYGCIFSLDTNGGNYKDLLDFNDTNGKNPYFTTPILVGNKLYGMALMGGAHDLGCIFSIDTDGTGYKKLLNFNNTDGVAPAGSLTCVSSVLYGMTQGGGNYNDGTIFSIDTDGSGYKDLHDFNGTNGESPSGDLTISGSVMYGMTYYGGIHNNDGVIFSVDTNGSGYTILHNFNDTDGASPQGSLTLSGNVLYGMTTNGGTLSEGTIFSIGTDGNRYTVLFDFGDTGAYPFGSLILSGNTLFGMTPLGGRGAGDIFSIDTNGNEYRELFDFDITDGSLPQGSLTISGNKLYGLTSGGVFNNCGDVFCFKDTNIKTSIIEFTATTGAINVYPNPNNGRFTIEFVGTQNFVSTIEVYNVLGEKVFTETLRSTQGDNTIDIGNQSSGIYFYRVVNEDGSLIGEGKVIIEK